MFSAGIPGYILSTEIVQIFFHFRDPEFFYGLRYGKRKFSSVIIPEFHLTCTNFQMWKKIPENYNLVIGRFLRVTLLC